MGVRGGGGGGGGVGMGQGERDVWTNEGDGEAIRTAVEGVARVSFQHVGAMLAAGRGILREAGVAGHGLRYVIHTVHLQTGLIFQRERETKRETERKREREREREKERER